MARLEGLVQISSISLTNVFFDIVDLKARRRELLNITFIEYMRVYKTKITNCTYCRNTFKMHGGVCY